MKVLSHEDDVLKNGYGAELTAIKREYYRICVDLVDDWAKAEGLKTLAPEAATRGGINTRTAVMGLFGMMNWLYTWYNPRVDPDAEVLAREISDIFLRGVRGGKSDNGKPRTATGRSARNGGAGKKSVSRRALASSGKSGR
jgi:hypothetical protein